jgi:hypothetical protein
MSRIVRRWSLALGTLLTVGLASSAPTSAQWGAIEGQFLLDGDIPKLAPLDTAAKDAEFCPPGSVPDESLVVDPGSRGIANIVLYLSKTPDKIHPDLTASAEKEIVFDQKGCRFLPHILFARTDQTILLKSADGTPHNTRATPFANMGINVIVSPNDRKGIPVQMPQPERTPPFPVSCDIHAWMKGHWIVRDHPYVAITDKDGKFKLEKLPAGELEFRVWQERPGYVIADPIKTGGKLTVTIKTDDTLKLPPIKVPVANLAKKQ